MSLSGLLSVVDEVLVLGWRRTKTAVPTRAWGEVGIAAAAGVGCCSGLWLWCWLVGGVIFEIFG